MNKLYIYILNIKISLRNYFIPYSPTPTEPWLTEASGNQGESRDVTTLPFPIFENKFFNG